MKNTHLFLLLVFLISFTATAQSNKTSFGIKGGVNLSNLTSDFYNNGEFNSKIGFALGAYFDLGVTDKLHIKPELLFSQQDAEYRLSLRNFFPGDFDPTISNVDFISEIKESFILVPLMVDYYPSEKINFEFGPQFGFLVSQDISDNNENFAIGSDDPPRFDLGINGGIGYNFSDKFRIGLRYSLGITDRDELRSSVFQLSLQHKLI